jgi:hypothetical protein
LKLGAGKKVFLKYAPFQRPISAQARFRWELSKHVFRSTFYRPANPGWPVKAFILEQHTLGVFAQLTQMILIAKYCEENSIRPYFQVSNNNLVEPERGPNWTDYFFEQRSIFQCDLAAVQLQIASGQVVRITSRYDINLLARGDRLEELQNELGDLREASRLFFRHFRFNPAVLGTACRFVGESFGMSSFLGVHYRATDKVGGEATPVTFEAMALEIAEHRAGMPLFVATDSSEFLEFCRTRFGGGVVSFSQPLGTSHLDQPDRNYDKSLTAIIDCLILSKSRVLIKTPSLLSAWSKVLNENLPLVLVGAPLRAPWGETSLNGLGYWPESRLYDRRPKVVEANRIIRFASPDDTTDVHNTL